MQGNSDSASNMGAKPRILLIEDDLAAAGTIGRWLSGRGEVVALMAVTGLRGNTLVGRDAANVRVEVDVTAISEVFLDYVFPGGVGARRVLAFLKENRVPEITAISSTDEFNTILVNAGANRSENKAALLRRCGALNV